MVAQSGDIVEITHRHDGVRWVATTTEGSPLGDPPYIRLMRHAEDGNWSTFTTYLPNVRTVERPTFDLDEEVVVGERPARVVELKGDMVRIKYEPRSVPLGKSGLSYHDEGGFSDIPLWRLALDNRLERKTDEDF